MDTGRIEQLIVNPFGFSEGMWQEVKDIELYDMADICQDCFDLYEYEDYVGIAHQILAMELELTE